MGAGELGKQGGAWARVKWRGGGACGVWNRRHRLGGLEELLGIEYKEGV